MLQIFPHCLRSGGEQSYSGAIWAFIWRPHNSIRFTAGPAIPPHSDSLGIMIFTPALWSTRFSPRSGRVTSTIVTEHQKPCDLALGEFRTSENLLAKELRRSDHGVMWTPGAGDSIVQPPVFGYRHRPERSQRLSTGVNVEARSEVA